MIYKEYEKFATRPSSTARILPVVSYSFLKGVKSFLTIPEDRVVATYYLEAEAYRKMLKNELRNALNDLDGHLEDYKVMRRKVVSTAKELKKQSRTKWGKELFNAYENYFKAQTVYGPYIFVPFSLEMYLEPEIQQEMPEEFAIAAAPARLTLIQEMQRMLLDRPAEEVFRKYNWLNEYSLYEKPYTISHFKELKKRTSKGEILKTVGEYEKNSRRFKALIRTIKDVNLRQKLILIHEYVFIRTDRIDAWKESLFNTRDFYQKITDKAPKGWAFYDSINLTNDEIRSILCQNRFPPLREVRLRAEKKGIIMDYRNGKLFLIKSKEQIAKIKKMISGQTARKEIKGFIASKGCVMSKATIVKNRSDLKKIKEGDIMVAVATEPLYAPFIKKCKALVTDEGGITCHAAIISRELKIPCIIGTKIATKVLKDGDLVEVDANNGIVKMLNK
jgi:phosphohistidine swiveling domain-containing protein